MKTKRMTNAGDNYLICDCRENFTKTEMMDLLIQCRGVNLVFLKNSPDADAEINTYDAAQHNIGISVGAILCAAEYLHKEFLAGPKLSIKTHDIVYSVFTAPEDQGDNENTLALKTNSEEFASDERDKTLRTQRICLDDLSFNLTSVFIGQPHAVVFCDSLTNYPLIQVANGLRINGFISYDTNVVVAKVINPNHIMIRIHNSVQEELRASGNAAMAAAIASFVNRFTPRTIDVICIGGNYIVHVSPNNNQIEIKGKVEIQEVNC